MTFDLQAARKHADTGGLMNTTKWLHAALAEIGRLNAVLADLDRQKALIQTCRICGEGKQSCSTLQLTVEQRADIQKAIDSITGVCMDDPMQYPELLTLLRSLLTGSVPAWEATEERKAAILDGMMAISRLRQIGEEEWGENGEATVLRAMLEETK